MPIYEYECEEHGRFEVYQAKMRLSLAGEKFYAFCRCGLLSRSVISRMNWQMGWKFLKDKSEKSPAAPVDAGYYPEWDGAYAP